MKTIVASLTVMVAGLAQAVEPLQLDFRNGDPFTAAFKALPGDAAKPMLVPTGGKPTVEDGKLVLANSRFALGAVAEADGKIAASTGSSRPAGVLDLSRPYKIVMKVAAVETVTAGKDNFFIYVNNSTSRGADSPLGSGSQLVKVSVGELKVGENVFVGKPADASSFLQIRAESGALVKIESLSVLPQ